MDTQTLDLSCPRCGYDLRTHVEMAADRCPECALLLPGVAREPAATYLERYAQCLAAHRARLRKGWHDWTGMGAPLLLGGADRPRGLLILLALFAAVLIWSGIHPHDRFTWMLEVAPAVIGVAVLVATYHRFRFTGLAYVLIFVHACILCVGGRYTYAEVPLGNWIRDAFGLARNHYDRLGHFAQGFVPAILAREILRRCSPVRRGKWLAFLVICICLSISAAYELLEWAVAAMTGQAADAFLGTQGDPWDTQKDMALAGLGAVVALLCLGRAHDHALRRLGFDPGGGEGSAPRS